MSCFPLIHVAIPDIFIDLLKPVTSTPYVPKAAPKGRKTVGKLKAKVHVYDGIGLRPVGISTEDDRLDLLEKVCTAMKRPHQKVEMGYEAPWSAKVGSKKCIAYLSNDEEYDDFWLSFSRQQKKAKGEEVLGIVIYNVMESTAQVCPLLFSSLSFFTDFDSLDYDEEVCRRGFSGKQER